MDPALTAFIVVIALLAAIPAWLAGSILKRHARQEGGGVSDWIPLGLLPYGFGRFHHRHKTAIVWAYLFSNLLFIAALAALVLLWRSR
jgi:hypothetical protein